MSTNWRDVALPWGPALNTFLEYKDDNDVLRTSIIAILMTTPGERVMLPDFGAGLLGKLFDPLDEELLGQIKAEVQEAIERWDDRIQFVDFQADPDPDNNAVRLRVLFRNAKDPVATQESVVEFSWTSEGA